MVGLDTELKPEEAAYFLRVTCMACLAAQDGGMEGRDGVKAQLMRRWTTFKKHQVVCLVTISCSISASFTVRVHHRHKTVRVCFLPFISALTTLFKMQSPCEGGESM